MFLKFLVNVFKTLLIPPPNFTSMNKWPMATYSPEQTIAIIKSSLWGHIQNIWTMLSYRFRKKKNFNCILITSHRSSMQLCCQEAKSCHYYI